MRRQMAWSILVAVLTILPVLAWQETAPQGEQEQGAAPASDGLSVTRAVACLEVKDREPVSIDTQFSNRTERIYCFTQIEGAADVTEVQHVWMHGGEEMARVTLPVRSASWRTHSSKQLLPEWTGAWKVEVRDSGGNVLKTVEFTVTEGETPGASRDSGEGAAEPGTQQ